MKIRMFNERMVLAGGVLLGALAKGASAAVLSISASVSTNVQELLNGSPGSVSLDSRSADSSAPEFSAHAVSLLESTDLAGALVGMGQAFSDFEDPRRLDQPNPEEFGLEAACYANAADVSYSIESDAVEARTIVFTSAGSAVAAPEIEFAADGTATAESRVFITGAVVFWSMESARDLTSVLARVDVSVSRDGVEDPLFDTSLAVAGDSNGRIRITTEGPLRTESVTLEELAQLGLDEDSLAVLEALEREGTLQVIAIPSQEHAYLYGVVADESFVLTAELKALVRNAPGGTGVAVVLGRPFENLADAIASALPELNGRNVERSINAAVAARDIGLVVEPTRSRTALCGAMGPGTVGLLGAGFTFLNTLRRKKRS